MVGDELETHILDQRDAFMRGGKDKDTATTDAIAEMGDAVTVGTMLDRSYRPHLDWKVLGCMLAIVLCSCLLSALLWRSGYYYADMIAPYFGMVGFYVALALPFCLIDFTCYAKIPRLLFAILAACLALSGAGVMIFWRTEALAMAFLPFASLLVLFHMRGPPRAELMSHRFLQNRFPHERSKRFVGNPIAQRPSQVNPHIVMQAEL